MPAGAPSRCKQPMHQSSHRSGEGAMPDDGCDTTRHTSVERRFSYDRCETRAEGVDTFDRAFVSRMGGHWHDCDLHEGHESMNVT